MPYRFQVRAVLLEEVILYLLEATGYRTVTSQGNDPTLTSNSAGMVVLGRGGQHQIDAIADYAFAPPFAHPQRLLVEAKFHDAGYKVDLKIIRNAVGVLKDAAEFWVRPKSGDPAGSRYHYQMAVFSASPFTPDAQDYAFAQDIYLLPLRDSAHFLGVLQAIQLAVDSLPGSEKLVDIDLTRLRQVARGALRGRTALPPLYMWLAFVLDEAKSIGEALLGSVGRAFPLFLVPRPGLDITQLERLVDVEIHFANLSDRRGWLLTRPGRGEVLFAFDLPSRLFQHYAKDGALSPGAALDIKATFLREIHALVSTADSQRLLTLRLDPAWLDRLREALDADKPE